MQHLQQQQKEADETSTECAICGRKDEVEGTEEASVSVGESFALRCNSCRRWYHPWCMGYQLDLDRSCMITASEIEVPIDPTTALPLICQWFCDSCASTVTGLVAVAAKRSRAPHVGVKRNGSNDKRAYKRTSKKRADKVKLIRVSWGWGGAYTRTYHDALCTSRIN